MNWSVACLDTCGFLPGSSHIPFHVMGSSNSHGNSVPRTQGWMGWDLGAPSRTEHTHLYHHSCCVTPSWEVALEVSPCTISPSTGALPAQVNYTQGGCSCSWESPLLPSLMWFICNFPRRAALCSLTSLWVQRKEVLWTGTASSLSDVFLSAVWEAQQSQAVKDLKAAVW